MANLLWLSATMLAIVATWSFLFGLFVGCGLCVSRASGLRTLPIVSPFLLFWLGWAGSLAFLQLWHLWLPVDGRALGALIAVSVLGWSDWRRLRPCWQDQRRRLSTRAHRNLVFGLCLVTLFWANVAMGSPHEGDTGLYHLQGVRWFSTYPIVPGLGNLHDRLAFNNSSFLYAALLDFGPWEHRSHHLANGLLSWVLLAELITHLPRALRPSGSQGQEEDIWQVMLLPAAWLWFYKSASSYTPDLATFALSVVVTQLLLRFLLERREALASGPTETCTATRAFRVFAVCVLAAAGLTVKLPFAPLGAFSVAMALLLWVRGETQRASACRYALCTATAVGLLWIVPWMARGVYLSGYVAYPQTWGAWDVPWRIPSEYVTRTREWWLLAFARAPHLDPEAVLTSWVWVGPWLSQQVRDWLWVTLPAACVLGGWLGFLREGADDRRRQALQLWGWLMLPSLATVAFMLWKAPNPRFAGPAIWMLASASLMLSLMAAQVDSELYQQRWRIVRGIVLALAIVAVTKSCRYTQAWRGETQLGQMPSAALETYETASGLKLYLPVEGDLAWDAPFPSTPTYNARLEARDPSDLSQGFWVR